VVSPCAGLAPIQTAILSHLRLLVKYCLARDYHRTLVLVHAPPEELHPGTRRGAAPAPTPSCCSTMVSAQTSIGDQPTLATVSLFLAHRHEIGEPVSFCK